MKDPLVRLDLGLQEYALVRGPDRKRLVDRCYYLIRLTNNTIEGPSCSLR